MRWRRHEIDPLCTCVHPLVVPPWPAGFGLSAGRRNAAYPAWRDEKTRPREDEGANSRSRSVLTLVFNSAELILPMHLCDQSTPSPYPRDQSNASPHPHDQSTHLTSITAASTSCVLLPTVDHPCEREEVGVSIHYKELCI